MSETPLNLLIIIIFNNAGILGSLHVRNSVVFKTEDRLFVLHHLALQANPEASSTFMGGIRLVQPKP